MARGVDNLSEAIYFVVAKVPVFDFFLPVSRHHEYRRRDGPVWEGRHLPPQA